MSKELLLKARTHFRAARTVETLRKIAVPEWDTEIHYWPEMSLDERRAVYAHLRMGDERTIADFVEASLAQVLARSRDANGARLFGDDDEQALRDTDPKVLQRISTEMGFGSGLSVEDAEKN